MPTIRVHLKREDVRLLASLASDRNQTLTAYLDYVIEVLARHLAPVRITSHDCYRRRPCEPDEAMRGLGAAGRATRAGRT